MEFGVLPRFGVVVLLLVVTLGPELDARNSVLTNKLGTQTTPAATVGHVHNLRGHRMGREFYIGQVHRRPL